MTVFAGIAEFEHALIRERTSAGRVVAKQRGVRFGRPQKLNAEQCTLALRLLDEGESVNEVAKSFKVHGSTIYRLLAESGKIHITPYRVAFELERISAC